MANTHADVGAACDRFTRQPAFGIRAGSARRPRRHVVRLTGVIALALAVLALGVGVSVAQPRRAGEVGITVYDDVDFRGATESYRNDVPDLRRFGMNDRISSLRVARGETWQVCENVNYGGRCVVVTGSDADLRSSGLNDTITSMRRLPDRDARREPAGVRDDRADRDDRNDRGGVGIRVYDDVNFRGEAETFRGDIADLREFGLNDRISSLQVAEGESWEVCENVNYEGRCVVFSGSEPDLRTRGLSDNITSLRRVPGRDGRRDRDER